VPWLRAEDRRQTGRKQSFPCKKEKPQQAQRLTGVSVCIRKNQKSKGVYPPMLRKDTIYPFEIIGLDK
jgi:hypothetical protein